MIEEQEKREEMRRKREEEKRKEEEEKQRKWEEYMLQKLDVHPFLVEIDLCDFLIKYCEKHLGKDQEKKEITKIVNEEEKKEQEERRKKTIEEALQKGRLMRAEKTKEDLFENKKKSAKQQNQQQYMWVYEEDDNLDLDIVMIKKFARLNITAPVFKQDLEKTLEDLIELKEAFIEKGDEEKNQAKEKFLRRVRGN